MPVVQVPFDMPKEIAEKISSGEYSRFGGVVRDAAGHIVAHLKEIKPERVLSEVRVNPQMPDNKVLENAVKFAKDNKKNFIIAAGTLLFVGGTAFVIHKVKTAKRKRDVKKDIKNNTELNEIGLLVNSYDLALNKYYEAIQLKTTDYKVINNLRKEFENIRDRARKGDLTFDVSIKELITLATVIQGYGSELRKANGFDAIPTENINNYDISLLIDYIIQKLKEQEEVFEIQIPTKEKEMVLV